MLHLGTMDLEKMAWGQRRGREDNCYFVAGTTTWFLSVWRRGSCPILSPFNTSATSRRAAVLRDGLFPTGEPRDLSVSLSPASTSNAAWLMVPGHLLDVNALFLLSQWRSEVFKRQIGVCQAAETSLDIEARGCQEHLTLGQGAGSKREFWKGCQRMKFGSTKGFQMGGLSCSGFVLA